jgi:hypothetical protein
MKATLFLTKMRDRVTGTVIDAAVDLAKASAPLVITATVITAFYLTVTRTTGETVNTESGCGTT